MKIEPWARCAECNAAVDKKTTGIPNEYGGVHSVADGYLRISLSLYTGREQGGPAGDIINSHRYYCLRCAPFVFKKLVPHVYK
jgi:hypothetical protein